MNETKDNWNERYRSGEFDPPDAPSPLVERTIGSLPEGRALNVATGTGRNAVFLAEQGYEVDAVDIADEALATARERASERSVSVNWTRADLDGHSFPEGAYDVVTMSFYRAFDRLPGVKEALAPDRGPPLRAPSSIGGSRRSRAEYRPLSPPIERSASRLPRSHRAPVRREDTNRRRWPNRCHRLARGPELDGGRAGVPGAVARS
jgi:SAM-dependent methyltransferase